MVINPPAIQASQIRPEKGRRTATIPVVKKFRAEDGSDHEKRRIVKPKTRRTGPS